MSMKLGLGSWLQGLVWGGGNDLCIPYLPPTPPPASATCVNGFLKKIPPKLSHRGWGRAEHFPTSLNPAGVARESLIL